MSNLEERILFLAGLAFAKDKDAPLLIKLLEQYAVSGQEPVNPVILRICEIAKISR